MDFKDVQKGQFYKDYGEFIFINDKTDKHLKIFVFYTTGPYLEARDGLYGRRIHKNDWNSDRYLYCNTKLIEDEKSVNSLRMALIMAVFKWNYPLG
jgi:hypothetical protein